MTHVPIRPSLTSNSRSWCPARSSSTSRALAIDLTLSRVRRSRRPVGCLGPEPRNPYDRNAIGVWDANRRAQVGYVPRELAPGIGQAIRGRNQFSAVCNFEFLEKRRRTGLSVLLAPTTFIQSLTVEDDNE